MDFHLSEELKMVQTLARDFVKERLIPLEKEVLGRESDLEGAKRQLPEDKETELADLARQLGLWGLGVPESLGGAGLGVLGSCVVEEELAKSIIYFNMGDVSPVLFECNELQRKEYLEPTLKGEKTARMALIEPGGGIDPSKLELQARKDNQGYILNGKKMVFSNQAGSDFFLVFAVTDPGKGIREGVSCFLVDTGQPGLTVNAPKGHTGWRSQVTTPTLLTFENCSVPLTALLGEEGRAFSLGKSWLPFRRIFRAARCVGAAVRLLDVSVTHINSWQSQGLTIAGWPGIQTAIADMGTDIQAARLMVYQAACAADEGEDVREKAAMVKVFSTEMLERVANRAVMIKGGPAPARELSLQILCRNMVVSNINLRALEVQKSIIAGHILNLGSIL